MLRSQSSPGIRVGYFVAAAIAATLTLFGATWLLTPAANSGIFGVVLQGASLAYGRVKGAEDLLLAALIGVFALRQEREALITTLWIGLILPIGDMLAVVSAGLANASALALHLLFVVFMPLSALLLQKERMVLP